MTAEQQEIAYQHRHIARMEKEIEELKLKISGKIFFDGKEFLQQEIAELKRREALSVVYIAELEETQRDLLKEVSDLNSYIMHLGPNI